MGAALAPGQGWAQSPDSNVRGDEADDTRPNRLLGDIKDYVAAPLHWDGRDWLYFGGTLAAVAAAHHYDSDVRRHFTIGSNVPLDGKDPKSLQDALPAAAVVAGTWLYANLIDDNVGRHEAWSMLEAGALSSATGFVLKYAAGRERPNVTTDPNSWRAGGSSFPSLHVTAAFAIGTVLAESGNDQYRWIRRVLGYGIAAATGYQRLNHNQHWLSDTVAAAALGTATAHFVMNRDDTRQQGGMAMCVPIERGVMLTYTYTLP
jgi:membrane-associated phospholipid phosphatase